MHRIERCAYIERSNRVGNGYSDVAACSAELWFICNQSVDLIGVELYCSFLMVPRRATKRIQFRFRHLSFRRRCLPDLALDRLGRGAAVESADSHEEGAAYKHRRQNKACDSQTQSAVGGTSH